MIAYGLDLSILCPKNSSLLRSQMASGSTVSAKSEGDKGKPCLFPRESGNGSDIIPFTSTEVTEEEQSSRIKEIKLGLKPKLLRVQNMYLHSTLLNAFSTSKERTISGESVVEVYIILKNHLVLKKECLPGIKPVLFWMNQVRYYSLETSGQDLGHYFEVQVQ